MEYNLSNRKKDNGLQFIISYKDSQGRWRQKSKQGFADNRDGKNKGKEWTRKTLADLENTLALCSDYESITFKDFTVLFLSDKSTSLSFNTVDTYNKAFLVFKDLNELELRKIKNIHIQRCIDTFFNNGFKVSSAKLYVGRLRTVFNSAVDDYDILLSNPVKKIKYPKQDVSSEKIVLSELEGNMLLNKVKDCHIKYYIFTLLGLKCGLRASEIVGLTWDCIDFFNLTLTVNKQWKYDKKTDTYGFGTLKSHNSYRSVPISKHVKSELLTYKSNYPISIDNRVLKYATTDSITSHVRKLYHKLNYNISPHNLRHTYATVLIYNGLDYRTVAMLMGHTMQETIKTYSHVNSDMIDKAKKIIDSL
ncbi:MAG: site-specific integrase [Clostridium sp.]